MKRSFPSRPTATLVAPASGIIFLAPACLHELWCSLLGYEPKVLRRGRRFVLAADLRFRAQNTSPRMTRAKRGGGPVGPAGRWLRRGVNMNRAYWLAGAMSLGMALALAQPATAADTI